MYAAYIRGVALRARTKIAVDVDLHVKPSGSGGKHQKSLVSSQTSVGAREVRYICAPVCAERIGYTLLDGSS